MRVSEHTALDCSMLELLQVLYSNVETEVTLHAACDTQDPRIKQTAHTLNCAGPAVIYIKVHLYMLCVKKCIIVWIKSILTFKKRES